MIKLTKNESKVFEAILATGAADADSIAYESGRSKVKVKSVLKDLIAKSAVYSFTQDEDVMFDITSANVEQYSEDTSHLVDEVTDEVEEQKPEIPQEAPPAKAEKKEKAPKEELDPAKFTKGGKPRKVTNAMKVREEIAKVKSNMTKEEAEVVIVQFCMEQLGQSKQLAKTYFKDNYDRVE